jgi:hypothetical protein
MEKRVSAKINEYLDVFKQDIKSWMEENNDIDFKNKSDFLKFIYDYNNLTLDKDDFSKRKRIKSHVPHYLRCLAKRANGEQCTRKKKDDSCYCGTHDKNRPHGVVDKDNENDVKLKKMEVRLQDINGILYYIDKFNNIYKTDDIIENKVNPSIIAKYKINDEGNYIILN